MRDVNNAYKITICIPTYNNSSFIADRIREEINIYEKMNYSLLILDSSSDNETADLVQEAQKYHENIVYRRYPSTLPSNIKVYDIFKRAGKELFCDYLWIRSDALWCHEVLLKSLPFYLSNNYDMVVTNTEACVRDGIWHTTSPQELFLKRGWQLCLYGAAIINVRTMLSEVDYGYLESKYMVKERMNFSHLALYFEQFIKMPKIDILVMDLPFGIYSGRKKNTSSWHKDIFQIWLRYWPNTINNFPEEYSDKLRVIRKWGKNNNFYKKYFLQRLEREKILTPEVYKKYESDIEKYAGVPKDIFFKAAYKLPIENSSDAVAFQKQEYDALNSFMKNHKNVVIYGCGKKAQRYAEYIISHQMDFDAFVVTDNKGMPCEILGHRIMMWDNYLLRQGTGIVLGLNTIYQIEVYPNLKGCAKNDIFRFFELEYYLLKNFAKTFDRLLIYGCGAKARRYAEFLMMEGMKFDAFVVSQKDKIPKILCHHRVFQFDQYHTLTDKTGMLLALNSVDQWEVCVNLLDFPIENIFAYPSSKEYMEYNVRMFKELQQHCIV